MTDTVGQNRVGGISFGMFRGPACIVSDKGAHFVCT